jgi:hypothetical protein
MPRYLLSCLSSLLVVRNQGCLKKHGIFIYSKTSCVVVYKLTLVFCSFKYVKFRVTAVFWDVAPLSLVEISRPLGGPSCMLLAPPEDGGSVLLLGKGKVVPVLN